MRPFTSTYERITAEQGDSDAWTCICGNQPSDDGFVPCNERGDQMEPLVSSNWAGLYVCTRCGRIIDAQTLKVVGINPSPILLS